MVVISIGDIIVCDIDIVQVICPELVAVTEICGLVPPSDVVARYLKDRISARGPVCGYMDTGFRI